MNTAKVYTDSNGEDCTINQMAKREPGWAANRIQEGEKYKKAFEELTEKFTSIYHKDAHNMEVVDWNMQDITDDFEPSTIKMIIEYWEER